MIACVGFELQGDSWHCKILDLGRVGNDGDPAIWRDFPSFKEPERA